MAEKTQYRSYDPDIETYGDQAGNYPIGSYKFGRSAQDRSIPLFLSDPDGEPDPSDFGIPLDRSRSVSISSKILASVLVAAAVAVLVAMFSSDDMRNLAVNAKASIATVLPGASVAAQPDSVQLTAKDIQLKEPQVKDSARLSGPAGQAPAAVIPNVFAPSVTAPSVPSQGAAMQNGAATQSAPPAAAPTTMAVAMAPSREEITTAYQSALQGRTPAAVAPAAPPARRLDPDELATLMTRAKSLLAAGDIPPARLLLERAADARDAGAALMLAQTYDPLVLGPQDARNIAPDPAMARTWYQRAVQLGSAEAQRRLSQMQN